MKEEWKVYIRGIEGRGDEVIKALTDRGATNTFDLKGNGYDRLYFINPSGIIKCCSAIDNDSELIKEFYKGIHLPPQHQHFKPFQKVLAGFSGEWTCDLYSHWDGNNHVCVGCVTADCGLHPTREGIGGQGA